MGGIHDHHRSRMRQRFVQSELEDFAPHEALELLLFYAIPRRDTNPTAHDLLERYGTLAAVLDAPLNELRDTPGIGESAAILIKLVSRLYRKAKLEEREVVITTTEQAGDYLLQCFDGERSETVYQLCLDRKGRLLSRRRMGEGGFQSAGVDIRRLVEAALLSSASEVIIAHNHPSGLAMPSREDYAATDRIQAALESVGILLRDHIIVAGDDYVSMRDSGYLCRH